MEIRLLELAERRQLKRWVVLALALTVVAYFGLPRLTPARIPLHAIDAGLLAFLVLFLIGAWLRHRAIARNEKAEAKNRLADLLREVRSGNSLVIRIPSWLGWLLCCTVFETLLIAGMIDSPSWRVVLPLVLLTSAELILFALWWPNRRGARAVLTATSIEIPGYGEIPWREVRAIESSTRGRRSELFWLSLYIPTLPARVSRCDRSIRWRRALIRDEIQRCTLNVRTGMRETQSRLVRDLSHALAHAATGGALLPDTPITVQQLQMMEEVDVAEAFTEDVRKRGAEMSVEDIEAHLAKLKRASSGPTTGR